MSWFDAAGPRGTHRDALAAQVIVIAKEPVPGRVKTRLTPPFTPQDAALLARRRSATAWPPPRPRR